MAKSIIDEALKDIFIKEKFTDANGIEVKIDQIKGEVILFFTSLYCADCIDLLPHLKGIDSYAEDHTIILFSDGANNEINDMIEYFEWEFSVISSAEHSITNYTTGFKFPFMMMLDEHKNLGCHGTTYNREDIIFKMNTIS